MDGRDEDGFEEPALRVVEEVAQAAGADSLGLDPLSVTIDPDARYALLANADQDVEVAVEVPTELSHRPL